MTVGQLIEELQQHDPNMLVVREVREYENLHKYYPIESLNFDVLAKMDSFFGYTYYRRARDDTHDNVEALVF